MRARVRDQRGRGPAPPPRARRIATPRSARSRAGRRCSAFGISTSRPGVSWRAGDGAQQDQRADLVAADERPRPAGVAAEAGEHLGEPLRRVGVARAVLGVAVQRQVGQHEPEAVGELLDQRLPLAVREQLRVQQRERRPGARLAVGDARAVVVVVEAELHRRSDR